MHDLGAELLRIGRELRGEYGATLTALASVLIVAGAAWRITVKVARGVVAAWRWLRGREEQDEEPETPEGA